ncbi:dual specificity protein kinase zak2-like isoform X2 [Paramacrobiotus metropolitanus]|uniref:dual specificity protein kinase zak2-like isoform X2 n=1 Tax=Paramacrobiotus metropolitanus TaxID=2943436 RepID=UPI002445E1AA|nr:dual specificity protein kinase zak2-like isoform X2 [Paramacrobiotus metropolitanus]
MSNIYAGNFRHKRCTRSSITYRVAVFKDAKPGSPGKTDENQLPLCGPQADAHFAVSGFGRLAEMTPLPTTAELMVIPSQRADAKNEMKELRMLLQPLVNATIDGNEHVQKYYGISYASGAPGLSSTCYILTEECNGLPLDEFMRQNGGGTEYTVVRYAAQILDGMQFLHDQQIIHLDIKGANIIVAPNGKAKITGLTMAKHFSGSSTPPQFIENAAGTVPFVSPEMAALSVKSQNHAKQTGRKTDIWSFGWVMVQMVEEGRPPRFTGYENQKSGEQKLPTYFREMHHLFKMGCRPYYTLEKDSLLNPVLKGCFISDPEKRFSAAQLITLLHELYYFLFCKIEPRFKQMELQRFKVERYSLERMTVEPNQPSPEVASSEKIVLTGNDGDEDKLLRKVTLPGMIGSNNPPGWASVISPAKVDDTQQRVVLENKFKVFELLIKEIAPQTKNIIIHYAVKPENPMTDLRIFTENEDAYTLLSDMLKTRRFKTAMIPGFTGQILNGLLLLHQYGIVHKDIRCSNILVDEMKNIAKIAHFEKATYHRWDSNLGTSIKYPEGSSQFASKEMQELLAFGTNSRATEVGPATDVFSLGCTGETTEGDFVRHMCALWSHGAKPDESGIRDANQPELEEKARAFVGFCTGPASERRSYETLKFHPFIRLAS